jgi:hypothetical protein
LSSPIDGSVQVFLGSTAAVTDDFRRAAPHAAEQFTIHDGLSTGPLKELVDADSWYQMRRAYWRTLLASADDEEDLPVDDVGKLKSAPEIVIWLSTSLGDQIAFAWLPAFLQAVDVDPERLRFIQFNRSERGREIMGLGMLNPQQLANHPAATRLTKNDLDELRVAWNALTAADPEPLIAYLGTPSERLPFLKRALRSLLPRYPDASVGVNAKELTLLSRVRVRAPRVPHVIGDVLAAEYEAAIAGTGALDPVGDSWLFSRMLRLGDPALPEPALALTDSRTEYRDTEARLTSFGERVLEGKANFLDTNGIDDWVAGVHLSSAAGRVWVHDRGQLLRI